MITPTKTVCYAKWANSVTWHRVYDSHDDGVLIESGWWSYGNFDRFVVREEETLAAHLKRIGPVTICQNWKDEERVDWYKAGVIRLLSS